MPGSAECRAALLAYLASQEVWEPLASQLRRVKALFGEPPLIQFTDDTSRSGSTKLELFGEKLLPVLRLTPEIDPLETLITLNHEMTHVVSLAARKRYLGDGKKLSGCLTRYQLLALEDETPAFRSEIAFWKAAPESFRAHFSGRSFESRLIGAKGDYESYYKALEAAIAREPRFVFLRYIDLGQYPACAAKLLKRRR